MTEKEVNEQLGKLIVETADDPEIIQILNDARLKLKDLSNGRKPITMG